MSSSKDHPIIMHVNYCEQGQSLAEIVSKAAQWGFDGVELRNKNRRVEQSQADYFDEIAKGLENVTLPQIFFGMTGPDLMQDDADARKKEAEDCIDFLGKAKARFGSKYFNVRTGPLRNPEKTSAYHKNGSGAAQPHHYEQAIEGYKPIAKFAEENDIILALETHMGYLHDLPTPCKKVTDGIGSPNVGAAFDYGNMYYFNEPIGMNEAIEMLGDSILYLHLKNSYYFPDGRSIKTSLAEGQINNRSMLRQLFARGFDGPICIEAPRPGDREWFAQQDLAYIESVIKDLKG